MLIQPACLSWSEEEFHSGALADGYAGAVDALTDEVGNMGQGFGTGLIGVANFLGDVIQYLVNTLAGYAASLRDLGHRVSGSSAEAKAFLDEGQFGLAAGSCQDDLTYLLWLDYDVQFRSCHEYARLRDRLRGMFVSHRMGLVTTHLVSIIWNRCRRSNPNYWNSSPMHHR